MTSICWKSAVTWSLLGLMLLLAALMYGPVRALAQEPDAVLYEVTEDMYLKDAAGKFVNSVVAGGRRTAVAQLSGWAKLGTPLCPAYVKLIAPKTKRCTLNATGADDLSLDTGKGTLAGSYTVVVQGYAVPAGTTAYDYLDAFYAPSLGTLAPAARPRHLPQGATVELTGVLRAAADPGAGRRLTGELDVVTEFGTAVGRGTVVVDTVT